MKIMVVDDEPDIQLLFEQRFRKEIREGLFQFHFAFDGQAALAFLEDTQNTDLVLILSDINMPGMSGLELLREIRVKRPGLQVFMITAYTDAEKEAAAAAYGANAFISKPIDFTELKQRMLNACGTAE
ncbi:MAG: response regulator [Candidatus Hydrogenedentes bacterium]|nr:response regulator [Candidatus Hydrogenedentota bacterium]